MGFRVVVASDNAGAEYRHFIKEDLQADPRVDEVIDVGVESTDGTYYPHVSAAGAKIIADGKADRGCSFAVLVWEWLSRRTRFMVFGLQLLMIHFL